MSPSDALILTGAVALFISAAVIVYRSLRLRSVLVDDSYRARAFWTAIGGLNGVGLLLGLYLVMIYGVSPTNTQVAIIQDVVWSLVLIGFYGWIASNMSVAISADFFNRDVLSWKTGGRIVVLAVIVAAEVTSSIPSSLYASRIITDLANFFLLAGLMVWIYAVAALALVSRRINDRVIKGYTKWVALSGLFTFLIYFSLGPASPSPGSAEIGVVSMAGWIYCMYRSVGSLAIRTRTLSGLGTSKLQV